MSGTIVLQRRIPGPFLSLRRMESVLENERLVTVIEDGMVRIGVVQPGERVKAGVSVLAICLRGEYHAFFKSASGQPPGSSAIGVARPA